MKNLFLCTLCFIITNGCSWIYGVKTVKSNDLTNIQYFLTKNNYNQYRNFCLKKEYVKYLKQTLPNDSLDKKYLLQPLQLVYLNNKNEIVSYHINCNAGGFPNLRWEREGNFDVFPPKTQTNPNDISLDFLAIQSYLFEVYARSKKINMDSEYKIIVFYSLMLPKQSKKLIDLAIRNSLSEPNSEIILINNDNLFAE